LGCHAESRSFNAIAPAEYELSKILHSLKSYTAHRANQLLATTGRFWQVEYFDRFIRDYHHFSRARAYIENNPVKAGLCARPEDWSYSSAHHR
jgi:putative DNA methylase